MLTRNKKLGTSFVILLHSNFGGNDAAKQNNPVVVCDKSVILRLRSYCRISKSNLHYSEQKINNYGSQMAIINSVI